MTKYSFLNELDQLLSGLPADDRKEILEDYEEHFAFAKRANKSDADVIELVGMPVDIANEILGSKIEAEEGSHQAGGLNNEAQAELLEAQAESLEAQAELLEAQAESLEAQAEALDAQTGAQKDTFGTQVGNLVDSFAATVGSAVGSISEAITETFETHAEDSLENAVQSNTLIEEIVDIAGITNVMINARNQKVKIEKTTYPTARVRLTKGILAVKTEGDTLYIEAREIKRKGIGLFINFEFPVLKIELPEMVYNLIQAKTMNAKIEVDSFELNKLDSESINGSLEISNTIANELELKTVNGKIEVKGSKGNINAKTSNGKIEVKAIDGAVCAKTTNSKIELKDITGDIDAETTNGKIEFHNKTIDQHVKLNTTNAKIEVGLLGKPAHATFELSTSNAKTVLFDTNRNYDVFGDGTHTVALSTWNAKIEVNTKTE